MALSHASSQTPPATPGSRPSQDTIKDRVSIHERPKTVDGRTEGGHWEGDLIICKRTRPVLVLHERKSRVTLAARLAGKTAAETISVMLAVFARIEPALRKSITFDNDTAFAQHALLANDARHDHLVLRCLCLVAKGRGRKRQRSITPLVASPDRHRPSVRRRNPGHRQSPPISRPEKAWASRPLSRRSSKKLAKTCKSGSHRPVALGSRIQEFGAPSALSIRSVPIQCRTCSPLERNVS